MSPATIRPVNAPHTLPTLGPWKCCLCPPGAISRPDALGDEGWWAAEVPGTAASVMQAVGLWNLDRALDADNYEWWFRTSFVHPGAPCHLRLGGLATLAEVWLNDQLLLTSDNMFRSYRVNITSHLREQNELVLGFHSLTEELKKKRPRPRWKTNLVAQQQLRWIRTSLLGRIPGWMPPVAPVGPWRGVELDTLPVAPPVWRITSSLIGEDGLVMLRGHIHASVSIHSCRLRVADQEEVVRLQPDADGWRLEGELRVHRPAQWWPHTHGAQPLYPCVVQLSTSGGDYQIDCGKLGFRRLEVIQGDPFTIRVNDVPIYCRGACWTIGDIVNPGSMATLEHDLRLARDAGINMLRVGGTMLYESDRFYELCDELGILVWQDFMFANMDYPSDDPAFAANIETEAREQLARLTPHPSLVVLCGNSEIEQQAAMLGMPRELWRNAWFGDKLAKLAAEYCPDASYVPSTPSGGTLPFHVREGITHYYGVGAYLRTPAELRQADVKFTPECLGFSHVPEPETVYAVTEGAAPVLHHPRWKQRVPRDTGPGWDFEDVRDFYLRHLFAVDPVQLRSFDMPRYLQLSRVVPGEMMAQVFGEWRSSHSQNQGGLVWFYKDLWPGAGWGIVDSFGIPKAAYYYLKRAWQSRQITLTNEGLDGLHLHAINETGKPLRGRIELLLLQDGHIVVARGEAACELPARGRQTFASDALLGGFFDVTYAYRFGPSKHDVVVATLFDEGGQSVSEAFHTVTPRVPNFLTAVNVEAVAQQVDAGCYDLHLHSDRFLQAVRFDCKGYLPDDSYFHLVPGRSRKVRFTAFRDHEAKLRVSMEALNLHEPVLVRCTESGASLPAAGP